MKPHAPWLLPGAVALVTGLATGLARLGWPTLDLPPGAHGPLMVGGFLGTLIGLERAVALGGRLPFAGPALSGAAALLLLANLPGSRLLMVLSALVMVAVNLRIARLRPAEFAWVMLGGSLAWLGGNLVWALGKPVPDATPWWIVFLVLTVAGERMELSRLRRLPAWAPWALRGALLVVAAGLFANRCPIHGALGWPITGLGLALTGAWFLHFDLARRTRQRPGLTGYAATGVLCGHFWLTVGGVLMALAGRQVAGGPYDAVLHAFFVGFAFSMVFAHAPLIAPGVLGIQVPFRPAFYVPLALLQVSLVTRIAGDLAGSPAARSYGGLLNAFALGLFLLTVIIATRSRRP